MRGDLHVHTRYSDGSMEVGEVFAYAAGAGLDCIAITDHDSTAGWAEAAEASVKYGVQFVRGIEFSCYDYSRSRKVHLLCYAPRTTHELEVICSSTSAERQRATEAMLEKAAQLYPLNAGHVHRYAQPGALYKSHIMHALVDMGYDTEIYGTLHRQLFGRRGSCRINFPYPDAFEVAAAIHRAGGLCVLAHMGVYDSFDVAEELAAAGLIDGVERHYPKLHAENAPRVQRIADAYGLICTGGSDFHGLYSSRRNILGNAVTVGGALRTVLGHNSTGV